MRIERHPIIEFVKGPTVKFCFAGRELQGFQGEPIAAALHAAGVKVLSHSPHLGRPRGFFCAIGNCSSCLMVVNGRPNVRVCVEKLTAGMTVERQRGRGRLVPAAPAAAEEAPAAAEEAPATAAGAAGGEARCG